MFFSFLLHKHLKWGAGSYGRYIFNFSEITKLFFQSSCFIFPPGVYEYSSCSTCLTTFDVVRLFVFSHSNRCKVVPHQGSNLHFPDDEQFKHHFNCLFAIKRTSFNITKCVSNGFFQLLVSEVYYLSYWKILCLHITLA